SAGTTDPDDDSLTYAWTITRTSGVPTPVVVQRFTTRDPTLTLTRSATYNATLVVSDASGARDTSTVRIAAGNEPPKVDVDIVGGNKTFYFPGVPVQYAVRVTDREDGSLANGRIPASRVLVTAEYARDGVALDSSGALSPAAA